MAGMFKGIALFTPGGDLVYCIDPQKQSRWHLQLCTALQDILGLPESPYFLTPYYTATVDRWIDPATYDVKLMGEASPLVMRHQALLNAVFETGELVWQPIPGLGPLSNPMVINTYRQQFPQLWEDHDLVLRLERSEPVPHFMENNGSTLSWSPLPPEKTQQGYVLRLYVSGRSLATERILQSLHQSLERSLQQPYTLKVVDIHRYPDLAETDQVAATPTLVRVWPLPARRLIGDVDDPSKIAQVLGLSSRSD